MKKEFSLLFVLILLVLALSYFLKGYVLRYVLEPILYALRIERILYDAFPQFVWWGIFLLIFVMIALHSLLRGQKSASIEVESLNEQPLSRVKTWSRWIEMSKRGNYSEWLLARHFADLALDILVYQERQPYERIRDRVLTNYEEMPPELRDYLMVGLNTPSFRHYSEFLGSTSWFRIRLRYQLAHLINSLFRGKRNLQVNDTTHYGGGLVASPLNLDPEIVIKFLESKIPSGGSL